MCYWCTAHLQLPELFKAMRIKIGAKQAEEMTSCWWLGSPLQRLYDSVKQNQYVLQQQKQLLAIPCSFKSL